MSVFLARPNRRHQPGRIPPTEGSANEAYVRSAAVRRAYEARCCGPA
jgi:hypothetical protein